MLSKTFTFYYNSDYEGANPTTSAELNSITTAGTPKGVGIADCKVYNLTEQIFVEARLIGNTD